MSQTPRRVRIAVIANMADPNVTPIFEALSESGECELLVLYETDVEPNRRWETAVGAFDHRFLRSFTIDLRRIHPDAFVHFPWRTLKHLREFKPDVVIGRGSGIWSSPANIAAFLCRHRFGWAFIPWWESFSRTQPTLPRRLMDRWVKHFLRSSDAVLACGTRSRKYLEKLGVDSTKIFVGPHATPHRTSTSSVTRSDLHAEFGRFLFVGQLIPRKGIDIALEAFSRISGSELWIVGDGELRELVEHRSIDDNSIRYLGHLSKDRVLDLYEQVDFLIVPSRYEVWGLVVQEALAAGVLCVVTDQVGASDDLVIDGVTGKITGANPEDLALGMAEIRNWSTARLDEGRSVGKELAEARSIPSSVSAHLRAARFACAQSGKS